MKISLWTILAGLSLGWLLLAGQSGAVSAHRSLRPPAQAAYLLTRLWVRDVQPTECDWLFESAAGGEAAAYRSLAAPDLRVWAGRLPPGTVVKYVGISYVIPGERDTGPELLAFSRFCRGKGVDFEYGPVR